MTGSPPRLGQLLQSSFFRLAVIYALAFGISVLVLLGFIYWATAVYMSDQADELIDVEIQGLAEQHRRRGLKGLAEVIRERLRRNPDSGMLYLFAGRSYRALEGNLSRWPRVEPDPDGWVDFRLEHRRDPEGKSRLARARVFQLQKDLHLLVGRDVHELEAIRDLIIRALTWGLVITAGLGLVGGLAFSWTTVRRIESINQTSREIMAGAMDRRIPTRGNGDDFDQLAENLNAMLDRISELVDGIRRVSDNVAHDLKTPLTRLRNQLERAEVEGPNASQEYLPDAIAEADRLLSMFNAMLKIVRIEADSAKQLTDTISLADLLGDVIELYEPLAEQKAITINTIFEPVPDIAGDRDLLFQSITNVLDNAIKFTPTGGKIDVSLSVTVRTHLDEVGAEPAGARQANSAPPKPAPPKPAQPKPAQPKVARPKLDPIGRERVTLRIADSGPGIPADERQRVFRRFYRVESSRREPGHGLGLSLVAAVVERHQGQITLESNDPGLAVLIHLPQSSVTQVN